jgi:hypothetical protein
MGDDHRERDNALIPSELLGVHHESVLHGGADQMCETFRPVLETTQCYPRWGIRCTILGLGAMQTHRLQGIGIRRRAFKEGRYGLIPGSAPHTTTEKDGNPTSTAQRVEDGEMSQLCRDDMRPTITQ